MGHRCHRHQRHHDQGIFILNFNLKKSTSNLTIFILKFKKSKIFNLKDLEIQNLVSAETKWNSDHVISVEIEKSGEICLGTFLGNLVTCQKIEDLNLNIEALMSTKHPNLVQYLGVSVIKGEDYLIAEYFPMGNLRKFLLDSQLEFSDLLDISCQCASALVHLHSLKILHKNLSLENLFISEKKNSTCNVKLGNFGNVSCRVKESQIRWMSMETMQFGEFTRKTDVWNFAVLIWEIFSMGKMPHGDMASRDVVKYVESGGRLEVLANVPKEMNEMLMRCWEEDPDKRPCMRDVQIQLEALKTSC
eukprot:TRINITY_DN6405_c2_g1_i1.p1 TRINITY_DN6405_c2_g1~~TRINITY_DN6405_c2_g1_i1.p1  ORF type:complete len:333 (-),score=122.89 TRINITY_DN6405_c2_g1_i1:20-931(-)